MAPGGELKLLPKLIAPAAYVGRQGKKTRKSKRSSRARARARDKDKGQ